MRLILGEADIGLRMTRLAGAHDVVGGKPRRRVGGLQDIVVPVAIVAGGDLRGVVGPAQRHRLAVVGLPVEFEPILVALAATLVAEGLEMTVVPRVLDRVGAVTVGANGTARIAL